MNKVDDKTLNWFLNGLAFDIDWNKAHDNDGENNREKEELYSLLTELKEHRKRIEREIELGGE